MAKESALTNILVPAVASIICALITSGALIKSSTIAVSDMPMTANEPHTADQPGFVTAYAVGSKDKKRDVYMHGYIDGRKVVSSVAADDTVGISISATSVFMPIRKGAVWRVDTDAPQQVTITWFSAEPKSWF